MTMNAVWYEQQGAADNVLIYGEKPIPAVNRGEVLVRLYSSAVNPSDVKKRLGAQPAGFNDGFVIPHSDGAGVIEVVGDDVPESRIGERVWVYQAQYSRHLGTAAQYVALPSALAATLPDQVSFETGACIGIPIMTAHRCVFIRNDLFGKRVLVTGASGRVGYYAAQWAKIAGADVLATAGSDDRCEIAAQSGADHVLSYYREDLADEIMRLTQNDGIDHIIDVEFGKNINISAAVLKTGGSISTYSSSLAPEPTIPFYPLMFKNISMNLVLVYNMPEPAKQHAIGDIYQALTAGHLKHRIAETWALEQTANAHNAVEVGGTDGCVVITID